MKKKFLQLASGILALIFICACWPGAFADAPDIVPASSTASSSAEASAANTVLDETSEDSGSSVGSESFQMSEAPSDTSESMKPVTTPSAASTPETVASEEISADSEANSIVEAPPSDALTLTSSRAALVSKEPLETASPYLPGAADDVLAMESVSIWDMEALPDDLYAAGWASDLYSESGGPQVDGEIVGKRAENKIHEFWHTGLLTCLLYGPNKICRSSISTGSGN